jgi:DNA-binding transcriptional ArsR family regulator
MKIYKSNSNTYFNLVSRALAELKDNKLVEVVNPEDRTGRIYRRTKEGERVSKQINLKD